jgi:hypothetical protein
MYILYYINNKRWKRKTITRIDTFPKRCFSTTADVSTMILNIILYTVSYSNNRVENLKFLQNTYLRNTHILSIIKHYAR